MNKSCLRAVVLLVVFVGLQGGSSQGDLSDLTVYGTYDFYCITNNDPLNAIVGEEQLSVDVANGGNEVTFIFNNVGLTDCAVMDVYFDDGTLLNMIGLIDNDDGVGGDPEVDFSQYADPPDLPGGDSIFPQFETTVGFSADADTPRPTFWAVSPGEQLGVVFSLRQISDNPPVYGTVHDVIDELNDGTLRIGIHLQSIGSGNGSEAYVNNIPEPTTMCLLGLGGLALLKRRKG
jgi:hypothetical protein